ncbi:NucA/NucB deoxyribonuclease domain-containing protein [Frankia sp. AiPa1]|uniref:NucA/NucB deoxyribonuclease domain-containing protein n=1 Tax=Frankia sp. AiPa1 TaxID=573492 RepID=UPI00202BA428|nr:NucA/NucB deoxyribonuclease domain-containing protein [Frankia sp. AiPa1]MCL9762971.1 NucA/NucB deoxyribonuclease domain-containing protein [Frankia sp. AiPa1]
MVLPTAQAASAATVASCAQQSAANLRGWYKSRYEWCKIEPLSAGERVDGKIVGTVSAVYAIAVTTNQKTRNVHVDFAIKSIKSTGTLANTTLSVQLPCAGCTAGAAKGRTATLSGWERDSGTTFDFTGGLGTGQDKVASHAFNPRFVLGGRLIYNAQGTSFRCDQANYVTSKSSGCVFTQYIPRLPLSYTRWPQVADHISYALNHPAGTVPAWRGKTIPSRLHRIYYDKRQRTKNRDAAIATCNKEFPGYTKLTPKRDCDEFPFATTREGAARGDLRYSARALNSGQNQLAGVDLNTFWLQNRVIDGDTFDVAFS